MTSRRRIRLIDVLVFGGLIAAAAGYGLRRPAASSAEDQTSAFAKQVDLAPLHKVAVMADGRLRSFESHATAYLRFVVGPRVIDGQSTSFTYLDMLLRPEKYADRDVVYVKNPLVLGQILDVLERDGHMEAARRKAIEKSKLIAPHLLDALPVQALLSQLSGDLVKTAKPVQQINSALAVMQDRVLGGELRLIPAPQGASDKQWTSLWNLSRKAPAEETDLAALAQVAGVPADTLKTLVEQWTQLAAAWKVENTAEVNRLLASLSDSLRALSPNGYPEAARLEWESRYFRMNSMTWIWLVYLASVIPLLLAVINRWSGARAVGLILFAIAFALQTASVAIRWYVSGRWPNANMFEAVTTSAWFGGVLALILELVARRSALKNLFALGSAVVSMTALMAAYLLPTDLDSSLSNIMPALHDVWLYIHTNMIIWSYAVIGLAAVTALLFLRQRWCALWDSGVVSKSRLAIMPVAFTLVHVTGWQILMAILGSERYDLRDSFWAGMLSRLGLGEGVAHAAAPYAALGVFGASVTVLLFEMLEARIRSRSLTSEDRGFAGPATAALASSPKANPFLTPGAPSSAQVFDAATMVTMQVAFIMLWAGIVMGAIWADHSWGRPWGWDPKEVFALNTFIIFLVLVHVRLKVRDKGFWTALIAVFGFETMMFNWIVINFIISGLHSYA
ncbi:MAG: cytochrome c biogenesis protein CcsA [Phycisphaerales bacterium]|nr:cytochrome c biogenesis protein CcsA [Phycisphaerales bacterium]